MRKIQPLFVRRETELLRKVETVINKVKSDSLELNRTGWGLGGDAPAREITEQWLSAIAVSNSSVVWLKLMHLYEVSL